MESTQQPKSKTTTPRPARRMKPGSHTAFVSANLHERIAIRAFEIYEQRIRHGPLMTGFDRVFDARPPAFLGAGQADHRIWTL